MIINCNYKTVVGESNHKIKEDSVQLFSKYQFIIKLSNIIYEKDGKDLKIPIFQGNMGDATYEEFRQYCLDKKYLEPNVAEGSFIIKAEKGKLSNTFRDFLKFYKGNILKNTDIHKPAKIKVFDDYLEIFYDFSVNGVPFVLQLNIHTDTSKIKDQNSIKSIFDLNLNENVVGPVLKYRFWDDYSSDEL